jgi:hypothetical protein
MWDDSRLVARTICEWVDGDGGADLGPAYAAASLPVG